MYFAVLGVVPDLGHVPTFGVKTGKEQGTGEQPPVLSIGAGLPPVPRKLVTRIQAGEFVDIAELLPDRMGVTSTPSFSSDKDEKQPLKMKRRQVTNIMEWVQCYSIYVAVLTSKYSDRIQDLMGYQALIVEAYIYGVWLRNLVRIRSPISTNGRSFSWYSVGQDRSNTLEHGLHRTRKSTPL